MKKQNFKIFKLNKKSISNFNSISGGSQSLFPCSGTIIPSCLICPKPEPEPDPSTYTGMPSWHNTVCETCL